MCTIIADHFKAMSQLANTTNENATFIGCTSLRNELVLDVSRGEKFIIHSCSHLRLNVTENHGNQTVARRVTIVVLAAHSLNISQITGVSATLEVYSDAELTVLPEVLDSRLLLQVTNTTVLLMNGSYNITGGEMSYFNDKPSLSVTGAGHFDIQNSKLHMPALKISTSKVSLFKIRTLVVLVQNWLTLSA